MSIITTKDGTQIYYKDWGTGQPIVFSHGWPLNSDSWEAQMVFLASHGYRAIAHDRIPATHAVDGVALACSAFIRYGITSRSSQGWIGEVAITPAPFTVIRRPPTCRQVSVGSSPVFLCCVLQLKDIC
ncbi:MAG: alpha/beta fold hydrolase [Brasilonema sp.]